MPRKSATKRSENKGAKRKTQGARRNAAGGPREHLHRLVEELPDDELRAAERFLAFLIVVGTLEDIYK